MSDEDFKDETIDFEANKEFRGSFKFLLEGDEEIEDLQNSEQDLSEDIQNLTMFHISTFMGDDVEKKISSGKELIQLIKFHWDKKITDFFESPAPLDSIMDSTIYDQKELQTIGWKLVSLLTKYSVFCTHYFVDHSLMKQLSLMLYKSKDEDYFDKNLKIILKTFHYIASKLIDDICDVLFQSIKLDTGLEVTPLECIFSAYENHITTKDQDISAEQSFSDDSSDINKVRELMLTFLLACLRCLAKDKRQQQISEISSLLAKSISIPYENLKIIALKGFNKCMTIFAEYSYTDYKENNLFSQLKVIFKQGPFPITYYSLQIFTSVIKFKTEECIPFIKFGFFDEINYFLDLHEEFTDKRQIKDFDIIRNQCIDFIDSFITIMLQEIRNNNDTKIYQSFLDIYNEFFHFPTFWLLSPIIISSSYQNKINAALCISHFIQFGTDEVIAILINEHVDMIKGLCYLLDIQQSSDTLKAIILALIRLTRVQKSLDLMPQFIELMDELDTRDLIEALIDSDSITDDVILYAKMLRNDLLNDDPEEDS